MKFVDLHLHGAFGVDVGRADSRALDRLAAGLSQRGYDAFLPTLVPAPWPEFCRALDVLAAWIAGHTSAEDRARPLGIHFEGPFLSPRRAGALPADALLDARRERDVVAFLDLLDRTPAVRMVTLAPEIPGGLDLVAELARRGVLVALGHTEADWDTLERACAAGARHVTHLCNAMAPFHHRAPGPVGFALATDGLSLDLIADGHHLHDAVLRLAFRSKKQGEVLLISDAVAPAGLGDGLFEAIGGAVAVRDGRAVRPDGRLAGAVALLDQAVERAVGAGVARADATFAASAAPARVLAQARGGGAS